MSVAEVDALLYLPGHDREAIARALRITALSPGWQGSFTSMLAAAPGATGNVGLTDAAAAPPVAWPGFRPVRVLSIVKRVRRSARSDSGPSTATRYQPRLQDSSSPSDFPVGTVLRRPPGAIRCPARSDARTTG